MPPRILIPVDESATTQRTIKAVLGNQDLLPQEILLLHVIDVQLAQRRVPETQKSMIYQSAEKSGKRILEKLAKPFREAGFSPTLQLELGSPGETIVKVVREQEIRLVIIGRHSDGGGFRDIMFGSVANYVIRAASCPVILL